MRATNGASVNNEYAHGGMAETHDLWKAEEEDLLNAMLMRQPMLVSCARCGTVVSTGAAEDGIEAFRQHLLAAHGETAVKRDGAVRGKRGIAIAGSEKRRAAAARGNEASAENRLTKNDLIAWRDTFESAFGRKPLSKDKGSPDHGAVKREFGSWGKFLEYGMAA